MKREWFRRVEWWVLMIALGLTLIVWRIGSLRDLTQQEEVKREADQLAEVITAELQAVNYYVQGVQGVYETREQVSAEELRHFVQTLSGKDPQTSLLRIGFVQKVETEELPAFEAEIRTEGEPDYQAEPNPEAQTQFYVSKVVDQIGKLYPPSGRNLMNDPKRQAAIERVIKSGEPDFTVTNNILNIAEYQGSGFVYTVPVYREGKLIGLINAVLSQTAFEEKIGQVLSETTGWKWSMNQEELVNKGQAGNQPIIRESINIPLEGENNWQIELTQRTRVNSLWTIVLFSGVVVSLSLFGVTYGLSSINRRVEEKVRAVTLIAQKYKIALESISNHVVITDQDGRIIYANTAAQKLTEYSLTEMLGETPRLWGGQMPKPFYDEMWRKIKTERQVYAGELTNRSKNGVLYRVWATITPILGLNQEVIGFVGIEEKSNLPEATKL